MSIIKLNTTQIALVPTTISSISAKSVQVIEVIQVGIQIGQDRVRNGFLPRIKS